MTDDDWTAGYRHAAPLTFAEQIVVLRAYAAQWSPAFLAGFLLETERTGRVESCTCLHCPIHSGAERQPKPGEN